MTARVVVIAAVAVLAASVPAARGQEHSLKRGWGGGGNLDHLNASNSEWYYHWWHTRPSIDSGAYPDWVPLIKYTNNLADKLNIVAGYTDVDTLLFLNEPEREDQSDTTVATAISSWEQVQAALPSHKLVSPAVSDNAEGQAWLADFMDQVETRNANADPSDDLRVDAVAFHWYGASTPNNPVGAANSFLSRVQDYYDQYQLPVWITEFAIHDWGGVYSDAEILEANRIFLETVIPELESRSYVEKYAYYHHFSDAAAFDGAPVTPTVVGDAYVGSISGGASFDLAGESLGSDVVYLRGGDLTNSGPALPSALRGLDVIEGANTLSGASDFAAVGAGVLRVRTGSSLTKLDANTVSFIGTDVQLDGDLILDEGALNLEDGSFTGQGAARIAAGTTLSMVNAGGRGVTTVEGVTLEVAGAVDGRTIFDGGALVEPTASTATFGADVTLNNATLNVGGTGFNEPADSTPAVTAGLQLEFDAAVDAPGDATWTNSAGSADDLFFAAAATPTAVSSAEFSALSAAYSIPTTGGATGLNGYFELGGPRSRIDATFEVVFHYDGSSADDQVLLEAGGVNRGVAFVMNDRDLTFNVDGDAGDLTITHSLSTGWRHAVGVIDLDSGGDAIHLYIDGQLVGSLTGQTIGDWAGGNLFGLGEAADSVTGVVGAPAPYAGQIALARYYADGFGINEVTQNHLALSPGFEPTTVTFEGDLTVGTDATLQLDVAAGGAADLVVVAENLIVNGGSLEVALEGANSIAAGDTFDLLDFALASGAFDSVSLPTLSTDLMWNVDRLLVDGTLLATIAGDFNGDLQVDAADYSVWRDLLGTNVTPFTSADADGDGLVGGGDYLVWRAQFGAAVDAPAALSTPEPAGVWLAVVFLAFVTRRIKQ